MSTKAISASGRREMPTMRWRVVWGRGVTMLTFCPTRALSRVDLPTLGRPTSAAKPLWNSGDGGCDMAIAYRGRWRGARAGCGPPSASAGWVARWTCRRSSRYRFAAAASMGRMICSAASCSARRRLKPWPTLWAPDVRDVAGDVEGLRVSLALDAIDRIPRQGVAARLEVLLQAGFCILERLRGR